MLICLDVRTGTGCGATNRDGAKMCQQCGKPLRYALELHDPGAIIGSYTIINIIGYGGFGAVYLAEKTNGSPVALKETFDPESIRSFESEFMVLSRLEHDHLPHYYDMFEAQGNGYLVMEYVPGQSLQDVLEQRQAKPLVEAQVMGYALQVCDALSYLHRQTPPLIHRDIKPDNIRLTADGLIKLVDFGLLKQGTDATRSSRRGLTPPYAPLEQWGSTGMHTAPPSDIYSLAATLYHLLTGEHPPIVTDRLAATVDPLVAAQSLNPRISTHVSDALMRALALQPHDRFADAATFKHALMGASVSPPPQSPPAPSPHQPKPAPQPARVVAPSPPRTKPLYPVTIAEWRAEEELCNTTFGSPAGYWCYVRPGKYLIGGWDEYKPGATITLPGFWIAKYPITVQQYRQFIDAGGYANKDYWTPNGWQWKRKEKRTQPYGWGEKPFSEDNQPVVGLWWYEATAFAAWLSAELAGTAPRGTRIRLPTEAEWEAAAAYDANMQRRTYPWGEQEPDATLADFGKDGQKDKPSPIGNHPAGAAACGAQNMGGSVWECTTSDHAKYPAASGVVVDDSGGWVPWRGGSWYTSYTLPRCSARPGGDGGDRSGARLARLFS